DDVVDRDRVADVRDADVFDHGAAAAKNGQRVVEVRADFSFQLPHGFADDAEAQAANAAIEIGGVVVDGVRRGRRVERIVSGDHAKEVGAFANGFGDDADLIDARSERHQAVAADAAVGRFESDDAAE